MNVPSAALLPDHDQTKNITVEALGGGATTYDWSKPYDVEKDADIVVPAKNQQHSFACGGFATAYHAQIHRKLATGKFTEDSSKFVIAQTFKLDAQGNMMGSFMKDNLSLASLQGVSAEALCASQTVDGEVTDSFLNRPQDITLEARTDAIKSKGNGYSFATELGADSLANSFEKMKGGQMLVRGENNGTWLTEEPAISKVGEWGHFMAFKSCEIRRGRKGFNFYQSLPGAPRVQWFDADWFASKFVAQVGFLVPPKIELPATYQFTRNLTVGSMGIDVKLLQHYLNERSFFVAMQGEGSPGKETNYFGALTKRALSKYQVAHGISPAIGYFGNITRAYINAHP